MEQETMAGLSRRSLLTRAGAAGLMTTAGGGLLAACSGSDGGNAGQSDYVQGSAELKVPLPEEIPNVLYPEGYKGPKARKLVPFGDGKTTFTMVTRTIPELDYATNSYAKLVEEVTGVKINYNPVPLGADGQAKVNAILSGGELPHAIMSGMGLFNISQVSAYGQQGLFIPLDQLIDENAPNIRECFNTFPELRKLFTSPDGRMYAVPSQSGCYHCKSSATRTWYNHQWLEAVGAKIPQTLTEFEALMDAFKGYSGKPGNSRMVTANKGNFMSILNFFMGAFCETSADNLLIRDGKLTWVPSDARYRDGIIWMQQQFANGNFDKAMFSMSQDQVQQLGDAKGGPAIGVTPGNSQGDFTTLVNVADPNSPGSIMQPLPPMEGPNGVRTTDWDWYLLASPNFVITTSCPDPVALIRWADAQFELSMTISMFSGKEGTGWNWAKEGAKGMRGKQASFSPVPGANQMKNQTWWAWGSFWKSDDQREAEEVLAGTTSIEPSLLSAGQLYEPYQVPQAMKVPPLVYSTDEAAEVSEMVTNLSQAVQQGLAGFATGKTDATKDADWQAFQDGFEKLGLSRYLETAQKVYDAQK